MRNDPLEILRLAIERIREPRLFETERGYQGQLKSEMDRLMQQHGGGEIDHALIEEEYQKHPELHGLRLRPDIVIHIPFERGVSPTRQHDNFLVVLLKLNPDERRANANFKQLETLCRTLAYPIGVSISINSSELWLPNYTPSPGGSFTLVEFAVALNSGALELQTARKVVGS